jgi:hypothetical protein
MSPTQRERDLAFYCATHMDEERCSKVLQMLTSDGSLTTRIINFCCANGLRRFVVNPGELEHAKHEHAKHEAPAVLGIVKTECICNYLSPNEQFCFHAESTIIGGNAQSNTKPTTIIYPIIHIGSHAFSVTCSPITHAQAHSAITSPLLRNNAFGVCINGYAVREIQVMTDRTIWAVCYGLNRRFQLQAASL